MEQRVSLITIGVDDPEVAARFYEALGWKRVESPDGVIAFDLIGQTLGLYPISALAEEIGVQADTLGGRGIDPQSQLPGKRRGRRAFGTCRRRWGRHSKTCF